MEFHGVSEALKGLQENLRILCRDLTGFQRGFRELEGISGSFQAILVGIREVPFTGVLREFQ